MVVSEYIPRFDTVNGNIALNQKNAKLLSELESVMDSFKKTFADNVFKGTAESMLKLTALTSDYFKVAGFGAKTLRNIESKLKVMQTTIGLDAKGGVIKGSYIDRLASTPQARALLTDYVRKGVEGEMRYSEFVKGFKELIEGNAEVDGALVKYSQQYVHDSVFQHSRSVDKFFADEIGIDCFYYAGDLIKTSRPFCAGGYDKKCGCTFEKHVGKVYTREEIESWNSLDWEGKIQGVDFFIVMAGYSCRHNLMPVPCDSITEEEMSEADPYL